MQVQSSVRSADVGCQMHFGFESRFHKIHRRLSEFKTLAIYLDLQYYSP
jgi:hypothetical protein